MTGGSNIRAIGPEDAPEAQGETASTEVDEALMLDEAFEEEWEYHEEPAVQRNWLAPMLALASIAGWSAFYIWANRAELLAGGTPQQWIGWISTWSLPVLLVVSLWILATRNSTREAERFGQVASTLSSESALLEERLTTVNRELSLAREFVASQSQELEALGRIATQRLSENAETLQSLIQSNGDQVDAIADVSSTAMENMSKLRDDLPVIANSAKDVSNQIGTAGRTAHLQVTELVAGFERLNEFGKASETQVESIQSKIEVALTSFEARTAEMEEMAEERFGAIQEKSDEFRTDLDGREVEALAAMRRRAEALEDEFSHTRNALEQEEEEALKSLRARLTAMREEAGTISNSVQEKETKALALWQERVEGMKASLVEAIDEVQSIDAKALASANSKLEALRQEAETIDANIAQRDSHLADQLSHRRESLAENEEQALNALSTRLAHLDAEIASRQEAQLAEAETLSTRSDAIVERIGALRATLEEVSQVADETRCSVTENVEQVVNSVTQSRETLEGTDHAVQELTEACVRLLELIQAGVQHSTVDLPEALTAAEQRLTEVRDEAIGLDSIVGQAAETTETLSSYVLKAQEDSRTTIADLDGLNDRIATSNTSSQKLMQSLREDLSGLNEQSDLLSIKAKQQLNEAITILSDAAKDVPATIETEIKANLEDLASKLGKDTSEALDRVLHDASRESIERFEETVAEANNLGRATTLQLRDQLAKVNELAGSLETRVARAREQAEEQVNNDFARRMALITESLNSNAIDIAKAMSSDVTDTAWASYLKGDRGIFTRRAVSLLDSTEARDIAEIYDDDPDFRENVSHYIHDFEAMLRSMLSTRDGNALSVTLLSSDMGKLYVALAQAIERLRD